MRLLPYCILTAISSPYRNDQHTDETYHADLKVLKVRDKFEEKLVKRIRDHMEICYEIVNEHECLITLFNHDYFWL